MCVPLEFYNPDTFPQAAKAKLNGSGTDAAAQRLRQVEAAAAAAETALGAERDKLAAQAVGLQSSISDLRSQLAAAKVRLGLQT